MIRMLEGLHKCFLYRVPHTGISTAAELSAVPGLIVQKELGDRDGYALTHRTSGARLATDRPRVECRWLAGILSGFPIDFTVETPEEIYMQLVELSYVELDTFDRIFCVRQAGARERLRLLRQALREGSVARKR